MSGWEIAVCVVVFLWMCLMSDKARRTERMVRYLCRMNGMDDQMLREIFDRPLED